MSGYGDKMFILEDDWGLEPEPILRSLQIHWPDATLSDLGDFEFTHEFRAPGSSLLVQFRSNTLVVESRKIRPEDRRRDCALVAHRIAQTIPRGRVLHYTNYELSCAIQATSDTPLRDFERLNQAPPFDLDAISD